MLDNLATVGDYTPEARDLVLSTCLTVAGALGEYMEEDVTIVGGLAPSLLVDQGALPEGVDPHPGTMDLDVALQLAVLEERRYATISERLRGAGFMPDRNEHGNETVQRWCIGTAPSTVRLDFLIPPTEMGPQNGIFHLEPDFGAIVARGIELAFRDRERIRLEGVSLRGDRATRDVHVCGPGALVVLKALACRGRERPKDAFDLYYVLRSYGRGVEDVTARLHPLLDDPAAQRAIHILRTDFTDPAREGPRRVARFLRMDGDEAVHADVVAFVSELLRQLERPA